MRAQIDTRLAEGCDNYVTLHHELTALGYKGSYSAVRRAAHTLTANLQDGQCTSTKPVSIRPISSRRAARLLVRIRTQLNEDELCIRDALCAADHSIATAHELAQSFSHMFRQRCPHEPDTWLMAAHASGIAELRAFAESIVRDYAAVKAALTTDWSNGQVEGQITRLKFVKRSMYGRANFELLRRRVLAA